MMAVARPVTPADVAEHQALIRIATLAARVMLVLRSAAHGRYSSERQLVGWLNDANMRWTASDLRPALDLLLTTGRIERGPADGTAPRAGWIPTRLA
jgi:hypothetical protein